MRDVEKIIVQIVIGKIAARIHEFNPVINDTDKCLCGLASDGVADMSIYSDLGTTCSTLPRALIVYMSPVKSEGGFVKKRSHMKNMAW